MPGRIPTLSESVTDVVTKKFRNDIIPSSPISQKLQNFPYSPVQQHVHYLRSWKHPLDRITTSYPPLKYTQRTQKNKHRQIQ